VAAGALGEQPADVSIGQPGARKRGGGLRGLGRGKGWFGRWRWVEHLGKLERQDVAQLGRIETGIGPGLPVALAVGAEGGIAGAARVGNGVAAGAGRVEGLVMERNPVGVGVRCRLDALADLDIGSQGLGAGNDRDRMAQVAFQAHCLAGGGDVLAIVAAETAGRIVVTDVIGMRGPIVFLVEELGLRVISAQCFNRIADGDRILGPEIRVELLVVGRNAGDGQVGVLHAGIVAV